MKEIFTHKDVKITDEEYLVSFLDGQENHIDNDFHNVINDENDLFYIDKDLNEINKALNDYFYSELHYNEVTVETIKDLVTVFAFNDQYVAVWN